MRECRYEKEAKDFCEAIKAMASSENAMLNFELYLSYHFDTWMKHFAKTPGGLVSEMKHFASITE